MQGSIRRAARIWQKKVSISWRRHLDSHRIRCIICPVYLLLHPPPWFPCDPPDLVGSHGRFFADKSQRNRSESRGRLSQIALQPIKTGSRDLQINRWRNGGDTYLQKRKVALVCFWALQNTKMKAGMCLAAVGWEDRSGPLRSVGTCM